MTVTKSKIRGIAVITMCITLGINGRASKLEKAYEALRIYDYFRAKNLFTQLQVKESNAFACYGLALIFSRADNPFSNTDSALKYANMSYNLYIRSGTKQQLSGFTIDNFSILGLTDSIAHKQFNRARKINSIAAYDYFLENNYLCNKSVLKVARYLRDELEFGRVLQANRSDSTVFYMTTHPLGNFYEEARLLLDRQLYEETTKRKTAAEYIYFLKKYPANVMVNAAHEKLYSIYKQQSDVKGLAAFVNNYPGALQTTEAWKLLFSLTVKAFSFVELKKFVAEYPRFPLKNSILKELELNKLVLYPYQQGDYTGFIDERGKFVIAPVYDAATDFYEGLSVVTKGDSVFFVNKENINPFEKVFTDAHVFTDGMAPVKINNKWQFINRQGLVASRQYDEINEQSEELYVVKLNDRYGALDRFGQPVIEPHFDKLGDFKNDYAYYIENGTYGFVSKTGVQHKAEFEWISDFGEDRTAIIKQKGKYGIVDANGNKILEPQFDQVIRTNWPVFIVVNDYSYGFFSLRGCFISQVAFDFMKEKAPDFYTNGAWFKLLKKGQQSLVDENGSTILNFGAYNEVNFANNGLVMVKKKKKYGYLDKKLTVSIPLKFDEANDFSDSLAVVKDKDRYLLINTLGGEVYKSNLPFEKISWNYYLINSEPKVLLDRRGDVVYSNVTHHQRLNKHLLVIAFDSGEIKLLND